MLLAEEIANEKAEKEIRGHAQQQVKYHKIVDCDLSHCS